MILFGIKDKGLGFCEIFPADNKYAAMRYFNDSVNSGRQTLLANHPEDFSLYSLGTFDQNTGEVTPKVEFIEEAITMKKEKN